jgi:hypothetical protein
MGKGRNSGGELGGRLMLVGAVLFVVSWLVPVYRAQDLLDTLPGLVSSLGANPNGTLNAMSGPDWLPGWSACKFAWSLLTADAAQMPEDHRWKQFLLGATCLTNALMVLGLLAAARRRLAIVVGLMLLGCTAANASWIYLVDQNPFDIYRAGYFLWLSSFALVGIGALVHAGKR